MQIISELYFCIVVVALFFVFKLLNQGRNEFAETDSVVMIPTTTSKSVFGWSDINAAWIHHVSVQFLGCVGILMPSVNLISPSPYDEDEDGDEDDEDDVLIRLNMGQDMCKGH